MRTHAHPARRRRILGTALAPLLALAAVLGGLGVVLALATAPAGAAVSPPAQGWTTTEAPLPADAGNGSTNPNVYLASSTCPIANGCVSVGWYSDTSGYAWGLIEQQNGTSWTDTEAPQPANSGTGSDQSFEFGSGQCGFAEPCRAVSCPSATFCVAVGQYRDSAGYYQPVVDTLSNGTWTSAEGALPGDTATDSTVVHPDGLFFSVSCASTTFCVAVGNYVNTSGVTNGLIATLSGTTWTAQAAPRPANASNTLNLNTISCPTASFCGAGGYFVDTSSGSAFNGWLLTLSNGTWSGMRAPEPSGAGDDGDAHQNAAVNQLTCPTAASCVGAGLYESSAGGFFPLLETWNGTGWTPLQGPLPAGADTTTPEFDQLAAVSCGSPTSCVAVGQYFGPGGTNYYGLIDTLSGGVWTPSQAPVPANVDPTEPETQLIELSCPTPGFCLTTGNYFNGTNSTAFTDVLSRGTWSLAPAQLPSPSNGASRGRTAACSSPAACIVTGQYTDPGNTQGFLDTWTGLQGYWLSATDGGIFTYGNGQFYGSTGNIKLNQPVVGMAATPDGQGYWFVASDGGVFNYGDAGFWGSAGNLKLNKPVVGMAATPDGKGYWLVASDGGVFTYGDAQFWGSAGNIRLNQPIVGMAATPDGRGYWLVASDGGIFSYGDALFYGSTGNIHLNKPVVGMAATPDGLGYWLVASDGGIFNYGDANFYGSTGNLTLNKPVVGMAPSPSGKGYWLVASDGGIFNYGDAPFYGSAGNLVLNKPMVGMAG
jgi:hypothetical protein